MTMNTITRSNAIQFSLHNLVLISSLFVVVNGAEAREHKQKISADASQVVAHISFHGQTVIDMAMQKDVHNKSYLYVQHAKDEGISVIDVTEPAKPKILGVVSWPNPAVASQMNVTGHLGIITESTALIVTMPFRTL